MQKALGGGFNRSHGEEERNNKQQTKPHFGFSFQRIDTGNGEQQLVLRPSSHNAYRGTTPYRAYPAEELCTRWRIKVSAQNRHKRAAKPFHNITLEMLEIKG
jgi:hypothetical protein